jgi:hypothetical protein
VRMMRCVSPLPTSCRAANSSSVNASRRNDRIQKNMRPLAAAQAGTRAHGQATSTSSIPRGLFRVTVKSGVAGGKLHGA